MHHPNDPYYKFLNTYYYIYFDNQFYVSELIKTRHYNHQSCGKQLIYCLNEIDLWTLNSLEDDSLIAVLNRAKKVETNIQTATALFKLFRKKITKLRHQFSREFEKDYHDFMGKIYDQNTKMTTSSEENFRRKILEVSTTKEQYPPELISLSQLLRSQRLDY